MPPTQALFGVVMTKQPDFVPAIAFTKESESLSFEKRVENQGMHFFGSAAIYIGLAVLSVYFWLVYHNPNRPTARSRCALCNRYMVAM